MKKQSIKNMGKAIFLSALLLIPGMAYGKSNTINIYLDGTQESIPSNMGSAYMSDGTTYVPLRFITEQLGHTVTYNQRLQAVVIDGSIYLYQSTYVVKSNRTYVPLRYISESLGYDVNYQISGNITYVYIGGTPGDMIKPSEPISEQEKSRKAADKKAETYFNDNLTGKWQSDYIGIQNMNITNYELTVGFNKADMQGAECYVYEASVDNWKNVIKVWIDVETGILYSYEAGSGWTQEY